MKYRLTEYSHGAGCGCKLSPGVLSDILRPDGQQTAFDSLLVGNETSDDAAVVDLDGETAIVSTTDFFMPIVDDPSDFGAIAATNAISDIYAMGAHPIVAISILGWPIDTLPASVAAEVIRGARDVCTKAGIPLAGGHSIDTPEPIFGLAVTGRVSVSRIKKNAGGKAGDLLYLTKPLGIGLVTTAQKKKLAEQQDLAIARDSMLTLNAVGQELGDLPYVHATTDVTGFGLAGHLLEVCDAGGLSAELWKARIPLFDFAHKYLDLDCIPGGTHRNLQTYGRRISGADDRMAKILADPQTSGGLLISIDPANAIEFEAFLLSKSLPSRAIGKLVEKKEPVIMCV